MFVDRGFQARENPRAIFWFSLDIVLNANNLLIMDARSGKAVLLTTYWDLSRLRLDNAALFENHEVTVYSGHYNDLQIECQHKEMGRGNVFHPWLFRPLYFDSPVSERYNPSIDQLFFNGLAIPGRRDFVELLSKKNEPGMDITISPEHSPKLELNHYYQVATSRRVCLSAPGIRDMCNRDIEFFMMGIPFIRPRFTSRLMLEIPDDVYIPVDCETHGVNQIGFAGMPCDHPALADAVQEKWHSIRQDSARLSQISRRARLFYEAHFTPQKIAEATLQCIESQLH